MKAKLVIRIGRSRSLDASPPPKRSAAVVLALFGKFNDQDCILAGEPDEHDEPDLSENVVVHSAQPTPPRAAKTHMGTTRMMLRGSDQLS